MERMTLTTKDLTELATLLNEHEESASPFFYYITYNGEELKFERVRPKLWKNLEVNLTIGIS